MVFSCLSPSTIFGESSPPLIITVEASSSALLTITVISEPRPTLRRGNRSKGTTTMAMRVRRSRRASVSSLRYTMPTFLTDISSTLRRSVMRRDDFYENLFQVLLPVSLPKLRKGAFRQQLAVLDNSDDVAQLLHLAHYVRRENHRLSPVPAFANKRDNGSRRHDVQAQRRLVEDHHRRIMHQRPRNRGLLLHPGGKLVAAPVAKAVHIQPVKNFIHALLQRGLIEAIQSAEIFDHFLRGQSRIERRRRGQEPDPRPYLLRFFHDVVPANHGCAVARLQNRRQHAQRGRFARAVRAQQPVDLARSADETHPVHRQDLSPLLVLERFAQLARFNHAVCPPLEKPSEWSLRNPGIPFPGNTCRPRRRLQQTRVKMSRCAGKRTVKRKPVPPASNRSRRASRMTFGQPDLIRW